MLKFDPELGFSIIHPLETILKVVKKSNGGESLVNPIMVAILKNINLEDQRALSF